MFGREKQLPGLNIAVANCICRKSQAGGARSHLRGPTSKAASLVSSSAVWTIFPFDLGHHEPAWERQGRGEGARADVEQHAEVVWLKCQAGSGKPHLMESWERRKQSRGKGFLLDGRSFREVAACRWAGRVAWWQAGREGWEGWLRETRLKSPGNEPGHDIKSFRSHRQPGPLVFHPATPTGVRDGSSSLDSLSHICSPAFNPGIWMGSGGSVQSVCPSTLRLPFMVLHLQCWCPFSGRTQSTANLQAEHIEGLTHQARAWQSRETKN